MLKRTLLLALLCPAAHAGEGPDILGIWDPFVISRTAAHTCATPDAATRTAHDANFATVATRARQELRRRYPKRTDDEIRAAMSQRDGWLTERTTSTVSTRGCADGEVQQIVVRYAAQARWKP